MSSRLVSRTLEQKIAHNCNCLSKNRLCTIHKGQAHPFNHSNHSRCKIPNLLAGLAFNIKYY